MKRIALFFCLLALLLCGCEGNETMGNMIDDTQIVSRSEREGRIEEEIENIEGVAGATVVIRGNTALIGLIIERGYEKDSADIKDMASSVARLADIGLKSTAVTCNSEVTDMIKNLKLLER
ncbi:MAG: YhcN/YlaJ family sporulation lipoprotein [Firmicutes bacterium]|nr:YhcN/YlaJ family sporulation lipoprotein [Bacillota bacterium]